MQHVISVSLIEDNHYSHNKPASHEHQYDQKLHT